MCGLALPAKDQKLLAGPVRHDKIEIPALAGASAGAGGGCSIVAMAVAAPGALCASSATAAGTLPMQVILPYFSPNLPSVRGQAETLGSVDPTQNRSIIMYARRSSFRFVLLVLVLVTLVSVRVHNCRQKENW